MTTDTTITLKSEDTIEVRTADRKEVRIVLESYGTFHIYMTPEQAWKLALDIEIIIDSMKVGL